MISRWLSFKLITVAKEGEYERAYYEYIISGLLFQIQEMFLIILISLVFGIFLNTILAIVLFMVLRIKIKGYHLSKKIDCVVASAIIICLGGFIGSYVNMIAEVIYIFIIVLFLKYYKDWRTINGKL